MIMSGVLIALAIPIGLYVASAWASEPGGRAASAGGPSVDLSERG